MMADRIGRRISTGERISIDSSNLNGPAPDGGSCVELLRHVVCCQRTTKGIVPQMTNTQLYLAVGVPIIVNIVFNTVLIGFMWVYINKRFDLMENHLTQMWRTELKRFEEVFDARLKHLEERFK